MLKFIKSNKILILFFALFALSLAYSFYFQYKPSVDARAYEDIALNLAEGRGYRETLEGPLSEDHAIIRAGPGYEFFLAGIYKIFGHRRVIVWFLQSLFHALAAFLIFKITKKILKCEKSEIAAFSAMAIYGFYPDLIIAASMLLTENLAIFILVFSAFIFFRYTEEQKTKDVFILGASTSFMVLVRTQLGLFVLPVLIFFVFKRRFAHLVLFFILFILVLTPWTIRNYQVFGKFIPTAVMFGNNLAMGNHPGASGEQMDIPYQSVENLFKNGYLKGDSLAVKFALNFIKDNPLEFAKITLYRISIYFSFARPAGFWPHFSSLNKAVTILFSVAYSFLILVLGMAGVLFSIRKKNFIFFFKEKLTGVLAIAFLMPLSVIFIIVETRYRYPFYPFLAIFAGIAGCFLFQSKKEILKPIFLSLIVIGGNTAFDIARNFSRIIARISGLL